MHTLILLATDPAIPTQPELRPGLTEDMITPGLLGFIATFAIVVVMVFLIRDMMKRIRRVRYRSQVEMSRQGGSHGPAAEHMGIPIMSEEAMRESSYEFLPEKTSSEKSAPAGASAAASSAASEEPASVQTSTPDEK